MSDIHKMSLSSLLGQIDSIKDNSASFLPGEGKQDPDKKIWQDDVDACNAATEIIKKLCEENCFSVDEAISYIAQSKKLLQDTIVDSRNTAAFFVMFFFIGSSIPRHKNMPVLVSYH